jgi:hypothetical protein
VTDPLSFCVVHSDRMQVAAEFLPWITVIIQASELSSRAAGARSAPTLATALE